MCSYRNKAFGGLGEWPFNNKIGNCFDSLPTCLLYGGYKLKIKPNHKQDYWLTMNEEGLLWTFMIKKGSHTGKSLGGTLESAEG